MKNLFIFGKNYKLDNFTEYQEISLSIIFIIDKVIYIIE